MSKQVAKTETPGLPAVLADLEARVLEVQDNMESIENFTLPKIKVTGAGFVPSEGEDATAEIEGVILYTKKTNVYYAKQYNPKDLKKEQPTCFSLDGNTPDASIAAPQSLACKGCHMAEWGTNSMKSGKACRNLKMIFLLLHEASIMPRQLVVTPTSLKAANAYLIDLLERGLAYRKVKTKITAYKEDDENKYCNLKFTRGEKLSAERTAEVDILKAKWLSKMDQQLDEETK